MKRILIIFFVFFAIPSFAQWKTAGFNAQIIAFGVHDTSFFISGPGLLSGPPGVLRFVPTGTPRSYWTEADTGIDFTQGNVTSFTSFGRYFFVNTGYRSSDDGASWQVKGGALGSSYGYIFSSSSTSAYRSGDSGNTWVGVPCPATNSFASIGAYVFANTGSAIWRSTDTGNAWSKISPPFAGVMTTMGSILFITSGAKVTESTDSGTQWNMVNVDSGSVQETVNVLATDGKNLFAGTTKGVYLSTDTGRTWHVENDGLGTLLNVNSLGVFDTLLFVNMPASGPDYYTAMRPIHEMTDTAPASVVQTLPLNDSIEVYPNPAAGIVTILSGGASIFGVSVLNVLGEDLLDRPNLHESEINLDISKLPSSTYFLRIETSNGIVLRKIVKEE